MGHQVGHKGSDALRLSRGEDRREEPRDRGRLREEVVSEDGDEPGQIGDGLVLLVDDLQEGVVI